MRLTTLDNGLRVASREMAGFSTAAVGLYADSGSRSEPAAINGIAHLFEHMVFKGAGGRSARELSEAIEDVGGELNACTERDGTSFTASVMPEHVGAGGRADLRSDPAARISPRPSWSARKTSCCRNWARPRTRPTTSSSTICGARRSTGQAIGPIDPRRHCEHRADYARRPRRRGGPGNIAAAI